MRKLFKCIILLSLLTACAKEEKPEVIIPKVGSGVEKGYGGDIEVTVTIEGTIVTDVVYEANKETPGIGADALDKLANAMVKEGSIEVDTISGATVTSEAFLKAAKSAVENAVEIEMEEEEK